MALSFNRTLGSSYFSAEVPDVEVNTSAASVQFALSYITHSTYGDIPVAIFHNTYYTSNGIVTVYDIRSVIEHYLRSNGKAACDFRITFTAGSEVITHDMLVLYCQQIPYGISAEDMIANHFLTSITTRFITPGTNYPLSFYLPFRESDRSPGNYRMVTIRYDVKCLLPDGSVYIYNSISGQRKSWGLVTVNITYASIIAMVHYQYPDALVLSCDITIGNCKTTFFIDQRHSQRQFYFRNAFNVWELAIIPASQKSVVETESSTAQCGDNLIQYDVEHTRTFELQSAPLLYDYARWLEQFVTSPDIRVKDRPEGYIAEPESFPQVLIVEYDYAIDDAPGVANTFTFTWKYANTRSHIMLTAATEGVFTEQFSAQFS